MENDFQFDKNKTREILQVIIIRGPVFMMIEFSLFYFTHYYDLYWDINEIEKKYHDSC